MNCFDVQISNPDINIVEVETCIGDNLPNSIDIVTYDNTSIVEISTCVVTFAEIDALIPVKNILSGSGINVVDTSGIFTISLSDTNLTASDISDFTESVQDIIGNSGLYAGNYIDINYNDTTGFTTISAIGLQPSGNYSLNGHNHTISDISNFTSGVSGLLPSLSGVGYINTSFTNNIYSISVSGLQPSGNYSIVGHTHKSSDITDFNSSVSGLIPSVTFTSLNGISGIVVTNSGTDYTISLNDPTIQLIDITDLSNNARTFLLTPSSNNLSTLISDETGSGLLVFNDSPSFTGIPTVPTATSGTNTNQIASTSFVRTEVSNLINSAPSTLDTLNELAQALGNDANFSTTITNYLASKASLSGAIFTGPVSIPSGTGNFNSLTVDNINVSLSGHDHIIAEVSGLQDVLNSKQPSGVYASGIHYHASSDITDFNSSVSGLLPFITGIGYVNSSFDNNTYSISVSGLQPSGNYSLDGHTHTVSQITDFNNGVSGLLPSISGSTYISTDFINNIYTISATGLQPSGNYSIIGHSHTSSDITNFDSSVSGLLPVKNISGSGYIQVSSSSGDFIVSATGLQPSGNYSVIGHTHVVSDITNFNTSVSGLLPVKDITSGTGISVTSSSGIYTINSTITEVERAASIVTTVFNKTANTINKGSVVYINGGQGDQPTISLAIANGEAGSSKTYGITYENITSMNTGRVVVVGALTGFNTDQFNPTAPVGDVNGTILYLSASVSGAMTTTKPLAPYHLVSVGTIVRTHQNAGVIEVRIQNGFELGELHNVSTNGSGDNGKFLQYNSGSGLWLSSSSGNFTSLSVNGTDVSVNGHSHTSSSITDFNSSVSGLLPSISGSTYITSTFSNNTYTINASNNIINSSNLYLWTNFK